MTWTTSHNKAEVHGLVSQPITAYVGHISWQLSLTTLSMVSANSVCEIIQAINMFLLDRLFHETFVIVDHCYH